MTLLEQLFSLSGRAVLVTGAAGGIGRVLARAMADAGATVGVHDLDLERVAAVAAEIPGAVALSGDLAEPHACQQLIDDAVRSLGRLDVLINCAAINRRKPISDVSPEEFDAVVAVNLRGVYLVSQAAHRVMRGQGGGKIINFGSLTSTWGLGSVSVYGATKAAIAGLTRTMAVEWAPDNVQVNCIAPGFIHTPMTETVWADEYKSEWMRARIPARRPGQPEELVGVILLLAAPASSYITGALINVDGGVLAGGSWE